MEELKQEIIITVTEQDFKRHNPKIEVDEMRLINFTERLMFIVQNRLAGIGKRYHTCVSMEPGQPEKSLWIPILLERIVGLLGYEKCSFEDDCDFCAKPEFGSWVELLRGDIVEALHYKCGKCIIESFQTIVNETLPIPPLPKK